ncbi:pyrroline-5-carboxylate dehydrogenase rocA [Mycobacterium tuberculosis]|nr:pyrroline-5-carboxylate dehydrogenase rocA [Mycobacterium tuberculosis]CFH43870.1 pyrroline-5-carboxylate dehydrogenase rocA [Mycobacterium tuberculosis]CKO11751.1 pyrroline-5-carboxylate dehydrogenase rocA [Mycobacterium tuberculosis]CKU71976.1 pyrroline-5-carboxylate dehydrogenase rocA [Mycobacterium tuberculosis]CKV41809.1 pyrroline-5-carboxylate dehydrogenase rocA [Mycobacterium tuberculosis]
MDAITQVPVPANEPVHDYAPKSPERTRLRTELASLADHPIDLPHVIGGRHRMGDGERIDVVQPHRHAARLGTLTNATHADAAAAVEAAMSAKSDWAALPFDERAAVFLRAADLLAGPWREKIAAATMLGQSKSVYQAEIDAVCELIDFCGSTSLSPDRFWSSSRSVARGNGTGSTTARWTVSSTRSRRSTSPRSPAICRPPRL